MLQILGIFSEIEVSITSGLYAGVAKVYDILLTIIHDTSDLTGTTFDSLIDTCYVLAGVFMLFRVAIGMIQMIINPDQITDAKVGAGKLMTRIILSIVMLILFVPSGILFGNEIGIFPRMERALLASDGIVMRLINDKVPDTPSSSGRSSSTSSSSKNNSDSSKSSNTLTCYYYDVEAIKNYGSSHSSNDITVGKFYKIIFSTKKKSGYTQMRGAVAGDKVKPHVYYYVSNARVKGGEFGDDFKYQSLPSNRVLYDTDNLFYKGGTWSWSDAKGVLPSKCPKLLDPSGNGDIKIREKSTNTSSGIVGGYTSPTKMINDINKKYKDDAVDSDGNPTVEEHDGTNGEKQYLTKLKYSNESIEFAQGTAASFQECADGSEKECQEAQTKMFLSKSGNNKIVQLIDDGDMDIGFMISLITGIGLIVYIIVLCVDVIVRRFKLMLLQVLSPIPAISYVDPNDKIFNQWFKMYISTYIDLFIKLIAIALAIGLLTTVFGFNTGDDSIWKTGGLLLRFFYIVAILVFAKLVPSMLSKIFGLDSMGGSFKDILGMGKAAAGFGAGAALGLGAGAITTGAALVAGARQGGFKGAAGAGLRALSSAGAAVVGGAASGAKGNIRAGAQQNFAIGKRQREAIADGSTLKGRTKAKLLNLAGFDNPYEKAVAKRDASQEYVNAAKAYEDESLSKVNKAIGNGYGNMFSNLVEARNDYQAIQNGEQVSKYRRVDNSDGTTDFINKLTGKTEASYSTGSLTDAEINHYNNETISAAEAEARINGEEKGAAKSMRAVFESNNPKMLEQYGYDINGDDYLEIKSLHDDAQEAALRAGYTAGYSSETKNRAKQDVKTYSAAARANKPDHDAIQRGS